MSKNGMELKGSCLIHKEKQAQERAKALLESLYSDGLAQKYEGGRIPSEEEGIIFHGTGSIALLGSDIPQLGKGILEDREIKTNGTEDPSLSGEAAVTLACTDPLRNWISFNIHPQFSLIYSFKVGNGDELEINSDSVLDRIAELFYDLVPSVRGRMHIVEWNRRVRYYYTGSKVRDEISDARRRLRRAEQGTPEYRRLERRLHLYENLRRKFQSMSQSEQERTRKELCSQFPVLLEIESEGIDLVCNPNVKIPELKGEELQAYEDIPAAKTRRVYVPERKLIEVRKMTEEHGYEIEAYNLEAYELQRIKRLAEGMGVAGEISQQTLPENIFKPLNLYTTK
jgi:hypothetical protein